MDSRGDEQDVEELQAAQEQLEAQEQRDVLLYLAVLASHLGQPLNYNVYFDNKLIAEKGRKITERMVARLHLLDPLHLTFRDS